MSPETFSSWQIWAVLSAVFAALTAIFAKVGVEDINSDLATFIRTVVVLVSFALILFSTGQSPIPGRSRRRAGSFWCFPGSAPAPRGCVISAR